MAKILTLISHTVFLTLVTIAFSLIANFFYKELEPQSSICDIAKILAFRDNEQNYYRIEIDLRMKIKKEERTIIYQNLLSLDDSEVDNEVDNFSRYFNNRTIPCYYVPRVYNSLDLYDRTYYSRLFKFCLQIIAIPAVVFWYLFHVYFYDKKK